MTVFVDTSAFLAYLDRSDENHETAVATWTQLLHNRELLVCTNYILIESSALIQNRLGMAAIRDFQELFIPLLRTEWIDESVHQTGVAAWLAANRRRLSLVDVTSFETMRRLFINTAFAFDQHFVEQGFSCLK